MIASSVSPKADDGDEHAHPFQRIFIHRSRCRPYALTRRQGCLTSVRQGQSDSGILTLIHAGQAAGSRFHCHSAFMEGDSGILPLDVTRPEPRRLCNVSAG